MGTFHVNELLELLLSATDVTKVLTQNKKECFMKSNLKLAIAISFVFSAASYASPYTVNPTSDGSLYVCSDCNTVSDGGYVLVSGYIQGSVKFSSQSIVGTPSSVLLTLNPYGLPLWGPTVDIYGYGTAIGALDVSDANAGTYIGTLTLPSQLGFGQDAFFDVTSFVKNINAPYIAFNLRTTGTDVFSSLEYNYGHPSQLIVKTAVPEPSSSAILLIGLAALGFDIRRRRKQ